LPELLLLTRPSFEATIKTIKRYRYPPLWN
jgi:hypothetical protein